jgi:hypothetical protein
MGKSVLRAVIDHPAMQLAGLYVYGEGKAGLDAGDIARRPRTGVVATRGIDDIVALQADVVIHCARLPMPYGGGAAEIARLLESGKNVISINGYSRPGYWDAERRALLEAACRKGGTTLMSAGLNPGLIGEQLALVATGACSRLDHIEVEETADSRAIRNPDYVFRFLGFGSDPQKVNPNDPTWGPTSSLNGMYAEVLSAMAGHLGWVLDRVDTDHRVFGATEDLQVAAGTIRKGTVSHVNWRWRGIVSGTPRLTMSIHWHMETAHLATPHPPLWQVRIDGEPGVQMAVSFRKRPDDTTKTEAEQLALAGAVINAIPVVCAAPLGLLTRPLAIPFQGGLAAAG